MFDFKRRKQIRFAEGEEPALYLTSIEKVRNRTLHKNLFSEREPPNEDAMITARNRNSKLRLR